MSEENGVGLIFHKKFVARNIINIPESIDKSFYDAIEYYRAVSDADKLLIKKYAQKNSCILQSAIFSVLEHVKFVHEVLEVDLTIDDNKAFVLAWEYMKLEVCEWIMHVVPNFRIKQTKMMECIQTSLLNGIIVMLEFAFNNFHNEFSALLLFNEFNNSTKFIPMHIVDWITEKFPELKPKYNLTHRKVCCGFSYNPEQPLHEEVTVTSCPVCIFEKEEYPEGKSGYILHLEHSICKECYNSMSDARLTSCPLCRQPDAIV
jgi:hypothetical protein